MTDYNEQALWLGLNYLGKLITEKILLPNYKE